MTGVTTGAPGTGKGVGSAGKWNEFHSFRECRPSSGVAVLTVSFHGVRGSTPSACGANERYGGNTSCVSLQREDAEPILFDMGTGLAVFGRSWPRGVPFVGHALVSHLHWDHIQGLPFFEPILRAGSRLDVHGPVIDGVRIGDAFDRFMRRPYFPVTISDLAGTIAFHDVDEGVFALGDARVAAAVVPHTGRRFGYRVEAAGVAVAYVSDHQQPGVDDHSVAPGVVELCRDVDLLIHDAQYDTDQFRAKTDWGHCTPEYAVDVALAAGARRLALFHHDPGHDDARLETLLEGARRHVDARGPLEVFLATEGLSLDLVGVADPPMARATSH